MRTWLRRGVVVILLATAIGNSGCFLLIAGAAGGAAGAASSAKASEKEDHAAMTYVGATLASCLYVPAKVLFAAGGALTSGVAYLVTLGNSEASNSVWRTAVEGDYVVTPRMMEGKEPVHFFGP
jgi:hypothetical protein